MINLLLSLLAAVPNPSAHIAKLLAAVASLETPKAVTLKVYVAISLFFRASVRSACRRSLVRVDMCVAQAEQPVQ